MVVPGTFAVFRPREPSHWAAQDGALARILDEVAGDYAIEWILGHSSPGGGFTQQNGLYAANDFDLLEGLRDLSAESVLAYLLAEP